MCIYIHRIVPLEITLPAMWGTTVRAEEVLLGQLYGDSDNPRFRKALRKLDPCTCASKRLVEKVMALVVLRGGFSWESMG